MFVFMSLLLYAQPKPKPSAIGTTTNTTDSLRADSLQTKAKPNAIDAEIKYNAKDSIVFTGNGTAYLHGSSDINYKNINLKADFVKVKMDSSTIFARGTTDSVGAKVGVPEFTEGDKTYSSRELNYNLKTKKGFIRQAVTQEGEGYIISDKTKKTQDDAFCMEGGKFTTCDNHDHPHFYLSMKRGKVKPGKYVVTGPAHLVIADVPLPIAIPFGFFPFTSDYSSGLLMPSYADELTRGFGLQNGGYYFAINDYADLELRGDIFTKGSWATRITSTYKKRYKYNGNLSFEYREDITGEKATPDYQNAQSLRLSWSHTQDPKANPNLTFSASVNFSTSGYAHNNFNYYARPEVSTNNTTFSSINFNKRFANLPSLSINGNMSVTQRASDSTIMMNLPGLNIAYSTFYPFKRKNPTGKTRWYEKISTSYNGTLSNSITTKENLLLKSSLSRDWQNGMQHRIPVSATFNILKYINITPSFNYTERWYLQSINKTWNTAKQKEVRDTTTKFNRVYDFSMGVSASTKLYGFYMPIRSIFGDKVDRIRHVISPTIGFSYNPDFSTERWGYYGSYIKNEIDKNNPTGYTESVVKYSHFEGSLYGTPSGQKSGSITYGLTNNVEMKLRNDKDTVGDKPFKIISLIDNLSFGGSYNLAADSMNWSNISVALRLKLTKNYSLNLNTSFDPYMFELNSKGQPVRTDKLYWKNGKLPRFLGTSTSYDVTINNETIKKLFGKKTNVDNKDKKGEKPTEANPNLANENNETEKPTATERDPDGFVKNTVNWSITANYGISYMPSSEFNYEKMRPNMKLSHNLSFSGNLELTKNWRFSTSTSYDFDSNSFTYSSININRTLHCWNMTGSVVPYGRLKSFTFRIGVNASMLSDLKWDKSSGYNSTNLINWY